MGRGVEQVQSHLPQQLQPGVIVGLVDTRARPLANWHRDWQPQLLLQLLMIGWGRFRSCCTRWRRGRTRWLLSRLLGCEGSC